MNGQNIITPRAGHYTARESENIMESIKAIEANPFYQQILADSFGGIMYDVANRGKYDTAEIVKLWAQLTPAEQESTGGIMKGAFNFIKEMEA